MRYKAILFDMDGTVLDTLEDLCAAVNHSLGKFGLPRLSLEQVRARLGNGARRLIEQSVPEETGTELFEQLLAYYKKYYGENCRIKTRPFEGIVPLLERLHRLGLKLAIVSNKPDPEVKALSAEFFSGLLETSVGESEGVRRKPWPDTALAAAKLMGFELEECLYVGDSEVDVATAKNAGMDCAAVSWGFRSREELIQSGAGFIADTVTELENFILL